MAAQAQLRKPTGTAAVAQRVIRQGGGKPAPSDTVNAKLTVGETVIPKELSEEALAPLVALYQRQGHLTQQDIEQFLYPILQNLEAGDEGMACGGRVGYAGGGLVDFLTETLTGKNPNVERNKQEVQQMREGTYQGQPEPAEAPQPRQSPQPAQQNPQGGIAGVIKQLRDANKKDVQGFGLGGVVDVPWNPA